MVGVSEAGIYSLAYSISQIMLLVNDSLNKTMSPWLYHKIAEKDYKAMPRVVYPSLILIAAANLALIAIAPEAVAIFAPPEYSEAIYVIPPVAMSSFALYLYLCFAPLEFYFEKRIWTTIATLTSAVLNIILNYLFIPLYGYQAAGYTTLACYLVNALMHYFFMNQVCRTELNGVKPYDVRVLLALTVGFITLGFIYIPLYAHLVLRYVYTFILLIMLIIQRKRFMFLFNSLAKKAGPKMEVS